MTTKKNGRPRAEIDQTEFEKLCGLQCAKLEICDWFSITDKTLDRWVKETYNGQTFSVVFRKKRIGGKIALRRNLLQMSAKNAAVAIFLAKNWLGMRDIPLGEDEGKPEPVKVEIVVKSAEKSNNDSD
jgi:hypothetical protein